MELTLQQKLEFPFPESAVSWRVGNTNKKRVARETNNANARPTKGQLLAYIDARDVMERLDRACGFENWQCRYTLADNGLLYSQWHTTALCSPTRSCFLTGRNHHQNGCSCITEGSVGFPGGNGHIPPSCGTLATPRGGRPASVRSPRRSG